MEKVRIKDTVKAVLRDKDGKIKQESNLDDLITTLGWSLLCDVIADTPQPAAAKYIAIGTGNAAPTLSDVTLESEITSDGGARKEGDYQHIPGTKVWRVTASFAFTASFSVNETGILNAAGGGTMLARQVFASTFSAVNGDKLQVEWVFTLG